MKKIMIYTNNGDHEITIQNNDAAIIEIKNGTKNTRYQLQGTKIKKIIGKKHREAVDMAIQGHKNKGKQAIQQ